MYIRIEPPVDAQTICSLSAIFAVAASGVEHRVHGLLSRKMMKDSLTCKLKAKYLGHFSFN
jgi:hypothetical protein